MLNNSRKAKVRIDYQVFHRTGRKIEMSNEDKSSEFPDKEIPTVSRSDDPGVRLQIMSQLQGLNEDLVDFLDENPIADIRDSSDDLDFVIQRTEELRSCFRNKFKELTLVHGCNSEDDGYKTLIHETKDYILEAKTARKNLRDASKYTTQMEYKVKKEGYVFLKNDVGKKMQVLYDYFQITDAALKEDFELARRTKESSEVEAKRRNIASKITELLKYISDEKQEEEFQKIRSDYDNLAKMSEKYFKRLKDKSKEFELEKEEAFKISKLGITLPKFKVTNPRWTCTPLKAHLKSYIPKIVPLV